jgi:hypothetical protein
MVDISSNLYKVASVIVLTNAISTRASRLINPDNYASIAGALADEEVGNAIAGDWVKVNDVFYSIITTSPGYLYRYQYVCPIP